MRDCVARWRQAIALRDDDRAAYFRPFPGPFACSSQASTALRRLKVVIVAVMRKMITALSAMLRDGAAWQPQSACAANTVAHSIDPPPLKWSALRYGFGAKEDDDAEEETQS